MMRRPTLTENQSAQFEDASSSRTDHSRRGESWWDWRYEGVVERGSDRRLKNAEIKHQQ